MANWWMFRVSEGNKRKALNHSESNSRKIFSGSKRYVAMTRSQSLGWSLGQCASGIPPEQYLLEIPSEKIFTVFHVDTWEALQGNRQNLRITFTLVSLVFLSLQRSILYTAPFYSLWELQTLHLVINLVEFELPPSSIGAFTIRRHPFPAKGKIVGRGIPVTMKPIQDLFWISVCPTKDIIVWYCGSEDRDIVLNGNCICWGSLNCAAFEHNDNIW